MVRYNTLFYFAYGAGAFLPYAIALPNPNPVALDEAAFDRGDLSMTTTPPPPPPPAPTTSSGPTSTSAGASETSTRAAETSDKASESSIGGTGTSSGVAGPTDAAGDLDGFNADADAPVLLDGPNPDQEFKEYTALGDSYSAGPGWEDGKQKDDPPGPKAPGFSTCHQRWGGWPVQVWNKLSGGETNFDKLHFLACTGYTTQQIREFEIENPDSGFGNPDLVSLTLGGNNNGAFADVVIKCPYGATAGPCDTAISKAKDTIKGISEELDLTIQAAVKKNPPKEGKRTTIVMGYPSFYNTESSQAICWRMSNKRREEINGLVRDLNDQLRQAVERAGADGDTVKYVDPDPGFKGRRFCEPVFQPQMEKRFDDHTTVTGDTFGNRAWFQGLPTGPIGVVTQKEFYIGLFHPTKSGMAAMAAAAVDTIRGSP
ncbi:MAG: hypothetical protein Q9214_001611 [Letrouitia sp. 1 TL-2023]